MMLTPKLMHLKFLAMDATATLVIFLAKVSFQEIEIISLKCLTLYDLL